MTPDLDAALRDVEVWAPDLAPDHRYAALPDVDLDALAHRVCGRLGGAPLRVGRSAMLMGVASRLWSVTVVPLARHGLMPDVGALRLRDDDGAVVLGVAPDAVGARPDPDALFGAVVDVLAPLVDALPLAERLLWGNVAASLHAVPRVHGLPAAAPLVADLLARAPLAGELDVDGHGRVRRRTCCLFYLVPGAGVCGDCPFDVAPGAPGAPATVEP